MKKRILTLTLALALVFLSLSACTTKGTPDAGGGTTATSTPAADPTPNGDVDPTETPAADPTETPEADPTKDPDADADPVVGLIEDAIESVQGGTLNFYPSKTLGEALDAFLEEPQWESLLAEDGNTYVNVSGGILYYDEPAIAVVQYKVNADDTFEFSAIEIDGEAFDYETYFQMIVVTFEEEILSIVRDGALSDYPDQPLGEALDSYLTDLTWEVLAGEDLETYVNASGTLMVDGAESVALLQYHVNAAEMTFVCNAFELDDEPQTDEVYLELMEQVFA